MKKLLTFFLIIGIIGVAMFLGLTEMVLGHMLYKPSQDAAGRAILLAGLSKAGIETGEVSIGPEWAALAASDPKRLYDPELKPFSAMNSGKQRIWGWYYPGKSEAGAILLCHGHGVSHNELRKVFAFLKPTGCHLLMLDFRAHGASDGDYTSIGQLEWEDLDAVLKEAEKLGFLPPERPLGAYGRSMGAATLVNGARHLPRIHAFLIEAMFPDLRKIGANDLKAYVGIPDNPLIDVAFAWGEWRTGISYIENSPEKELVQIAPRPLMIIHDGLDRRLHEDDFTRLKNGAPFAQTIVFEKAKHVGAHGSEPERFEREFLSFFASAGIPLNIHADSISTSSVSVGR